MEIFVNGIFLRKVFEYIFLKIILNNIRMQKQETRKLDTKSSLLDTFGCGM